VDELLKELRQDVKEIRKDVKAIASHTARNTTSLEVHMARTEANEKRLDLVEKVLLGIVLSGGVAVFIKLFI
jgi:hypothetical protein